MPRFWETVVNRRTQDAITPGHAKKGKYTFEIIYKLIRPLREIRVVMKIIPFSQFTDGGHLEGQKAEATWVWRKEWSRARVGRSGGKNERNSCRLHTRLVCSRAPQPRQHSGGEAWTLNQGFGVQPCPTPSLCLSFPIQMSQVLAFTLRD